MSSQSSSRPLLARAAARAAALALQMSLIAAVLVVAAAAAPRWSIVPLPNLKNAALSPADLRSVGAVFLVYHLVAYLASMAALREMPFATARRALAELFVVMAASSLASCHLFLFSLVPFSTNFHALVGVLGPLSLAAPSLAFGLARRRAGPGRALLASRPLQLLLSRWTALTCALVALPGALAVLYKLNADFANVVNYTRVTLNMGAPARFGLVDAFPGVTFDQPMDVRFAPDGQAYVLERPGRLVRISGGPGPQRREVILDLVPEVGGTHIEVGALSFALHPEFGAPRSANNGYAYVYYTHCRPGLQRQRLARFDLTSPDVAASRLLLVDQGRPPSGFHNGGAVFFDAQGFLYWTCGDFALRRAQAIDEGLSGGVLRIDVDRRGGEVSGPILRQPRDGVTAHYFIPRSNPFAGSPDALGEFFALGLRNPFRASFDPQTGLVWVGDVGKDEVEEVTCLDAGGNGQWPFCEGPTRKAQTPDGLVGHEVAPTYSYPQTAVDRAIIGGGVYRGDRYPSLSGRYVFADNNSGLIRGLDLSGPGPPRAEVLARCELLGQQGITSIQPAPDGALLVTALGSSRRPSGRVLRLERAHADDTAGVVGRGGAPEAPASYAHVSAMYDRVCSRCHGLDGRGEPFFAGGITARPDFTQASWQRSRRDDDLRRAVVGGGEAVGRSRDMPAWRGLFTEEELPLVVRRIRAFEAEGGPR